VKVNRWSVWLADLDPVIGSEQGRKRPVIVVSVSDLNEILPVVSIVPITSRKANRRVYPNEALLPVGSANLRSESIALCYQIRAIDKRRLERLIGSLEDAALRRAILDSLNIQLRVDVE
jgi:mRNA interferase MazF